MSSDDEILERLQTLNTLGAALSSERDLDSLLERILEAARDFAGADGGTLYRVRDRQLHFEVVRNDTLALKLGGKHGAPIDFAPLPIYAEDGHASAATVVAQAAWSGHTVNIADAYATRDFDFSGTYAFDRSTGYRSQSFLTVPMKDHAGRVIGVLQLINAKDAHGAVRAFSPADQQLVESLASQAAIVLDNRQLVLQLEALFESLIGLINTAIDEKSPYTGGHCERVPILTMLLAEAAQRSEIGALAEFRLSDADRYELKIAGLLHDCGKITTPVHVIDKATKLETLFDRIALVDTRFEVLRRDAEIALLKGEIDASSYDQRCRQLAADRELVQRCNAGGEFLEDAELRALAAIAKNSWRNQRGEIQPLLSAEELDNLSVRRGTLTAAEREIINHHIVVTIKMLEALPWPPHLRRVPEYAGGHHERMDGRGYPRGLVREQMSIPARVMGIADIFEALTARDRPYKPAKALSESLQILGRMKQDGHIDPDLFEVFLREHVYLDYARRFLDPAQIDRIDWQRIPGISAGLATELAQSDPQRDR